MHNTYKHKVVEDADITLNAILDVIVEGVWDWNGSTGHVSRSPGWYRMLGYEVGVFKEDVFTWENIIHPSDYSRVMRHFEDYIHGKIDTYHIEYRCRTASDDYIWIIDRGKIVEYGADNTVARMIGVHHNIHQQKIAQEELLKQNRMLLNGNASLETVINAKTQELKKKNRLLNDKMSEVEYISNTDFLTSVANRKMFEETLSKEVSRANRYNHPLSLALIDIDLFKDINDTYGHKFGDDVLLQVSNLIAKHIRDIDFIARWGGDEFVIIYPDLTQDNAAQACEKLRVLINQFKFKQGITISCSFGVTQYQQSDTAQSLFHKVDNCLYLSKKAGRNQVYKTT